MRRFLLALVLVLWSNTAWSSEVWVMLLDLSGSMGDQKTGSPLARNLPQIESVVGSAGKETTILVIGFGRRSDTPLLKAVMPKQAGPQEKYLKATRQAAIAKLKENLSVRIAGVDRSKSEIHGAIMRAARMFAESDRAKKLYIFSDMLDNETFGLSLQKLAVREIMPPSGITYPDLRGVTVVCRSAFADPDVVNTRQVETAIARLKAFWTGYFRQTGGTLAEYRTSY